MDDLRKIESSDLNTNVRLAARGLDKHADGTTSVAAKDNWSI